MSLVIQDPRPREAEPIHRTFVAACWATWASAPIVVAVSGSWAPATLPVVMAWIGALPVPWILVSLPFLVATTAMFGVSTSSMIESTSVLLKTQTADVEAQTTGAGVDLAALQRAWDNVFATLDQIDSYKSTALETMRVTVRELTGQVERSRAYVEHLERADGVKASGAESRAETSMLRIS